MSANNSFGLFDFANNFFQDFSSPPSSKKIMVRPLPVIVLNFPIHTSLTQYVYGMTNQLKSRAKIANLQASTKEKLSIQHPIFVSNDHRRHNHHVFSLVESKTHTPGYCKATNHSIRFSLSLSRLSFLTAGART